MTLVSAAQPSLLFFQQCCDCHWFLWKNDSQLLILWMTGLSLGIGYFYPFKFQLATRSIMSNLLALVTCNVWIKDHLIHSRILQRGLFLWLSFWVLPPHFVFEPLWKVTCFLGPSFVSSRGASCEKVCNSSHSFSLSSSVTMSTPSA